MSDFDRVMDAAQKRGCHVQEIHNSWLVTHDNAPINAETPRLTMSRTIDLLGARVMHYTSWDTGDLITANQAVELIESGALRPKHDVQRVLDAAKAAGYTTKLADINSHWVTRYDVPIGDGTPKLLVAMTGDRRGAYVIRSFGDGSNCVMDAESTISLIEEGML